MRKKVLIISYYWPPAGGPGVQRWLKFVKYFPENNIEPVLFIPKNVNYPILDYSLSQEVNKNIKIIRHPIFEFSSLFRNNKRLNLLRSGNISTGKKQSLFERILFFLRGNLVFPDMKLFWRKTSVNFLEKYLLKNQIQTIVTTGPPHSVHLIGLDLKEKLNIKWIADFRDPWVNLNYLNNFQLLPWSKKIHKKLRDSVLINADAVVVTSEKLKILFDSITKNCYKITNGYDYEYKDVELDNKFSISHIGSVYPERDPQQLWIVLEKLCIDIKGFKDDLILNFVGNVNIDFKKDLKSKSFSESVKYHGYVEYDKTIDFACKSQLLLMIEANDEGSSYAIPGKFFDYLNSHRPILAIGPKGSEIDKILKDSNTGLFYDHNEFESLYNYILDRYNKFKKQSNYILSNKIDKYSRKLLAKKYTDIINNI